MATRSIDNGAVASFEKNGHGTGGRRGGARGKLPSDTREKGRNKKGGEKGKSWEQRLPEYDFKGKKRLS